MTEDRPKRITQADLEALRKSVEHATIADIDAEWKDGADPAHIKAVAEYLHHFAARKRDDPGNPCLRCGAHLHRTMVDQLFGSGGFEWGLAHGHGYCRNCGWPATLYHFIKDADGKEVMTVRHVVLQAHPDDIEIIAWAK